MSETLTHIVKKESLAPELRFKEFEGEWIKTSFGEMALFVNGKAYKQAELLLEGKYKVLRVGNLFSKSDWYYSDLELDENKYVEDGDLMYAWSASFGPHFWSGPKTIYHYHIWKVIPAEQTDKQFLFQSFLNDLERIKSQSQGGTMFHITKGNIEQRKIGFPSLPEQQKIAAFLTAVDDKMRQVSRKKELLEQYKKGVMQKLFSQKLRFKDENGQDYPNWEEAVIQDVFERIKEKNKENNQNVMSISAQLGLVNQLDYFNRSVSAADVKGYYLLKKGDFAYNKSYSKGYPMGAIKRLEFYDKGVVSTLYICFRIKENDDSTFYKDFLDHGGINRELHKIAQEGARNHGLLNMSVIEFFRDIKVPRPCVQEQNKIGQYLTNLSLRIDLASKELDQTQTFKKGLLQQMFV